MLLFVMPWLQMPSFTVSMPNLSLPIRLLQKINNLIQQGLNKNIADCWQMPPGIYIPRGFLFFCWALVGLDRLHRLEPETDKP